MIFRYTFYSSDRFSGNSDDGYFRFPAEGLIPKHLQHRKFLMRTSFTSGTTLLGGTNNRVFAVMASFPSGYTKQSPVCSQDGILHLGMATEKFGLQYDIADPPETIYTYSPSECFAHTMDYPNFQEFQIKVLNFDEGDAGALDFPNGWIMSLEFELLPELA